MCAVSVPVFAADEYASAEELYKAWYLDLPDYITGVWSTDGGSYNLTFGIRAVGCKSSKERNSIPCER